jgi:hypothetical protein
MRSESALRAVTSDIDRLLSDEQPIGLLFDLRQMTLFPLKIQDQAVGHVETLRHKYESNCRCKAFVTQHVAVRVGVRSMFGRTHLNVPIQTFNATEPAMAWLRTFFPLEV